MYTSLISLFSSSAASSAAGSASVTSSTFGLMDVAVGVQEVRRVETITGSRVWLSVGAGIEREADGYGKYCVSIDGDSGITVEY